MIPYGRQDIRQEDVEAVVEILRSDFLTQGPTVPAFEEAFVERVGASHGVATNSATSSLHLACLALGAGPGDVVWTTPTTFVASANCARYCGAEVDFVDIDLQTWNMSVAALREKLEQAERDGRLPKIVIPVHLCGQPCEMESIGELAQQYGFKVIEDASHAIGARYQGEPVGNCRYSDIAVFSFHPVKIITTGEGGLATTRDPEAAKRMRLLRSHGVTRDPEQMVGESLGPWYYEQVALGFNYRMTDMQAALGLSQLQRLDEVVTRRHELARAYDEALAGLPLQLPFNHPDTYSALHLYPVRLRLDRIRRTHREVFEELRSGGVGVNLHYIPVHTQPYYRDLGFSVGQFPEAERYHAEAISLPMFPTLSNEQQQEVVRVLREALEA
ncbi:MAG: UDP-4-amino-4,6-dideoxy-N-acetyl-beta-L-altrosamine transaminase [Planctomycetota bacterium]|nr:UDP-4-amino-4,6-dideoxy-N-acetyl-beta-L-altrosamine transaminase [Planctomycetota bacterium]MDG2144022.1 UDP-4-amino-4,6-dideoxy-N-acetyl-beta-L-altrosamine transaminase [Planctomycetota bacterium]